MTKSVEQNETKSTSVQANILRSLELIDSNELINGIDSFKALIESHYKSLAEWQLSLAYDGIVGSNSENQEEQQALMQRVSFSNYTMDSLRGEYVVFFDRPVFVSKIKLLRKSNISVNDSNDVIRLISWKDEIKQAITVTKRSNINPHHTSSSFELYQMVIGMILPSGSKLASVNLIDFKQLFSNQDTLTELTKARVKLEVESLSYKENLQKYLVNINDSIKRNKAEYEDLKSSIEIMLEEKGRVEDSLEEVSIIKVRTERNLEKINETLNFAKKNNLEIKADNELALGDLSDTRLKVADEVAKLSTVQKQMSLEQDKLTQLEGKLESAQKGIDEYSLNMSGFSKASRMHLWFCYMIMAALLSTLTNIFFQIYGNASSFVDFIDDAEGKVSTLDLLLSRLPLFTATTLVVGTLSTLLFFLVKHIVTLHTDKMNMLKSSILTEQVTYSLDCEGKSQEEIVELKRKSKIDILVRVFGFSDNSSKNGIDENKQIDLIAKVIDTVKSKT